MSPLARGTLFAVLSALAFGASAPLVRIFGADAGPWTTAALLYAGAAFVGIASARGSSKEAPPRDAALVRVAAAGVLGAALAPALFAWGLQHTTALDGSLALAFEGAATVVFAATFLREHIGARVVLAVAATAFGAVLLACANATQLAPFSIGTIAVIVATIAWAADSTITGSLARFDPGRVTFLKCALGAALSALIAVALRERSLIVWHAAALVVVGAFAYGVSLQWYLAAQRAFGAARAASVFSLAPFAGAVVAIGLGDRPSLVTAIAGAVLLLAVYLHATERHGHEHAHAAERHEHAHTHDDGHHHHHHHDAWADGASHSHDHVHAGERHVHAHGSDFHHNHDHD